MDQVKARLESERADIPVGKHGRDDEDLILWFLRDRKFDVDATIAKLIKALEWRREFGVDEITKKHQSAELQLPGKLIIMILFPRMESQ